MWLWYTRTKKEKFMEKETIIFLDIDDTITSICHIGPNLSSAHWEEDRFRKYCLSKESG